MEMDPEVTKRTLGTAYKNLTADAILATTKKLLAVNKLETEPDDRDHLAFQTIHGPEDLISERIGKDRQTMNKMHWFATNKGNLGHLQPGMFSRAIRAAFTQSGLGQAAEEVNAAELVDHQGRISRLGEGGIGGNVQAIPLESRSVHPSQLAFIDNLKTPESFKAGVDLRTAYGVKKSNDGRLLAPFRDVKTGKITYKTPQQLTDMVVAFPNELNSRNPMIAAMNKGKMGYVPRDQVDVELTSN
jgi:DNA-directed RNA polymerase subunit beta